MPRRIIQKINAEIYAVYTVDLRDAVSESRLSGKAAFAVANLIVDHGITCRGDERDRCGRPFAVSHAGRHDLNAKMVRLVQGAYTLAGHLKVEDIP